DEIFLFLLVRVVDHKLVFVKVRVQLSSASHTLDGMITWRRIVQLGSDFSVLLHVSQSHTTEQHHARSFRTWSSVHCGSARSIPKVNPRPQPAKVGATSSHFENGFGQKNSTS